MAAASRSVPGSRSARTHRPADRGVTIFGVGPGDMASARAPDAIPVVHAVTSEEIVSRPGFVDIASGVMGALGARGALHLRTGRMSAASMHRMAISLAAAQRVTGAWLVINDRVDLALVVGARGAQLTTRSLHVGDARLAAPALALGASVHDLQDGAEAAAEGADWLVAGHVFPTASHPGDPPRGEQLVRALAAELVVPVIAIGGIRPEHCRSLRAHGAAGVAVIRGIWDAPNAERAASDYLSAHDDAGDA